MKKRPLVSVIIPVREISYYLIFENLPAFENQTVKQFEVIVLPNEQTLYDLTLLKKYKWLRIVPTGSITRPALKRDIGAKHAKSKILAFLDDDAYPTANWIEMGIHSLKRTSVAASGGPGKVPPNPGGWELSFDQVLTSFVGSGGLSYRFTEGKRRFVDDYPSMNFFIKTEIFKKLGGFNNDYWPGEDSKLCNDIVYKENKKILYDPRIVVFHHRRNSLYAFIRQHASYGFHRGAFFAQGDANSKRVAYLLPSLFIIYLLILSIISLPVILFNIRSALLLFVPFILYLLVICSIFLRSLGKTKNILVSLRSAITVGVMHGAYGILFFRGFKKGLAQKNIYG